MNPVVKFQESTRLFRNRYGQFAGTWIWAQLLKEKLLEHGRTFSVYVPGWRAPVFLRAKTSDVEVFCQIFQHAELEMDLLPQRAQYIIDAGANIGLASVFFSQRFPEARIDAVEVSGDNLELLRKNTAPYPNVHVVPKGLWWRTASLRISNPSAEPWAFQVEETRSDESDAIQATGVSDLLKSSKAELLDIIKIDIEGSEKDLFEHPAEWLAKTKLLMIELHEHLKPGCTDALHDALGDSVSNSAVKGEYHLFLLENS